MSTFTLVGQMVSGDPFLSGGNINITTSVTSELTFTELDGFLDDPLAGEFVSFDGGLTQLSYTLLGYGDVRGDPLQYAGFIRIDMGDGTFQTVAIDMNTDGDRQPNLMNGNTKLAVADLDTATGGDFPPPPCFTPGTMIVTARGTLPVRALRTGDMVLTRDSGYQPIRWIGARRLSVSDLRRLPHLAPIVLRPEALPSLAGRPALVVSPQHRILVTHPALDLLTGSAEALVPAVQFLPCSGVSRRADKPVTYMHILFDRHELVCANGVWTESFQPNSAMVDGFEEAARDEVFALFPELENRTDRPADAFSAARPTLRGYEARVVLGSRMAA